jgi:hypothetical protein
MMRRIPGLVASAWLGAGLLFSAIVAPALFRLLPTRAMAGTVAGAVLPVLFWSGIFLGVLLIGASGRRRMAGVVAGGIVALCCAGAELVVGARLRDLREELPADLESLAATDPRRVAFGRLHGISVALLGLAMASGAAWIALDVRNKG